LKLLEPILLKGLVEPELDFVEDFGVELKLPDLKPLLVDDFVVLLKLPERKPLEAPLGAAYTTSFPKIEFVIKFKFVFAVAAWIKLKELNASGLTMLPNKNKKVNVIVNKKRFFLMLVTP
jgi:hypothetical protein